jgi:hypothetical protein
MVPHPLAGEQVWPRGIQDQLPEEWQNFIMINADYDKR